MNKTPSSFHHLLEPGTIGRLKTRNRMVKSGSDLFRDDWERFASFYETVAKGGIGLIMTGAVAVDSPLGHRGPYKFHIEDDKYVPNFSKVVEGVHKHDCPIFLQLWHAGPWHRTKYTGLQPIGASAVPATQLIGPEYQTARSLTIPEIEEIVEKFVKAAERARKAGFDGVEVNGSACHLINSFFSRVWNKRDDAYGRASLENRARLAVQIIRAIKDHLGRDFPVGVKINGIEDGHQEGTTIEEAQGFARILQAAGADAIGVRVFILGGEARALFPEQTFYPEPIQPLPKGFDWSGNGAGAYVPIAAAIKKAVSIPVTTEGRLSPLLGEKILRERKADFINMTRRLLADPELPNKVASGRLDDIAPCTACQTCAETVAEDGNAICRVNAALGIEHQYEIKEAEKKKRVMVIGGGPAGMEAARVAALRGHEVMLYEKEHKLGGLLPLAALVKGFEIEDLVPLIRYLVTQVTKLGVKITVGKEVGLSLIENVKPDVVILATGGVPDIPEIPGIHGRNVVSGPDLHRLLKIYLRFIGPKLLRWLTGFWMPVGKKVVIMGGAIQGAELAEFLVKRSRKVTIIAGDEPIGDGLPGRKQLFLAQWLKEKGATIITGATCEEITDRGLTIVSKEGQRQMIDADTIIPAMPFAANTGLLKAMEGRVPEVYAIGDCSEPRLIVDAVADGSRIARRI